MNPLKFCKPRCALAFLIPNRGIIPSLSKFPPGLPLSPVQELVDFLLLNAHLRRPRLGPKCPTLVDKELYEVVIDRVLHRIPKRRSV